MAQSHNEHADRGAVHGVPQVSLLGATIEGSLVGLSIVAGKGCDMDPLAGAKA